MVVKDLIELLDAKDMTPDTTALRIMKGGI